MQARSHSFLRRAALLMALAPIGPSALADNLVVNGSLDLFPAAGPVAWSFLNPVGEWWNSYGAQPSPEGGSYLGLQDLAAFSPRANAVGISQPINGLEIGASYTLTFWSMTNHDALQLSAYQDWIVDFGGDSLAGQHTRYRGISPWVQSTLVFTAHATTQTLSFSAYYSPDSYDEMLNLDGVVLLKTAVAVPEPSIVALLAGGLAAVGLLTVRAPCGFVGVRKRFANARAGSPSIC